MASQWGDMTPPYRQAIHAAIIKNFGSPQTKEEAARPLEELTAIPVGIRYALTTCTLIVIHHTHPYRNTVIIHSLIRRTNGDTCGHQVYPYHTPLSYILSSSDTLVHHALS